jgi:hypothetical protein
MAALSNGAKSPKCRDAHDPAWLAKMKQVPNRQAQREASDFFNHIVPKLPAPSYAWQRRHSTLESHIKWMFTTEKACAKVRRAYPQNKDS